jgi:hypothetical protein
MYTFFVSESTKGRRTNMLGSKCVIHLMQSLEQVENVQHEDSPVVQVVTVDHFKRGYCSSWRQSRDPTNRINFPGAEGELFIESKTCTG